MKSRDIQEARIKLEISLRDLKRFAYYRSRTINSVKEFKRPRVVPKQVQNSYFRTKERISIVLHPTITFIRRIFGRGNIEQIR